MNTESNVVTKIEDIQNPKAIEFHKEHYAKFIKAFRNKLADAMSTTSSDKSAELMAQAEALRYKYNKQLREHCAFSKWSE
jgi:hypothetical protein